MRDASVADIAWGFVFAAIAWTALAVGDGYEDRGLLIAVLVTIWAVRLGGYIAWRHDGEDKRYVAMRKKQGARRLRSAACSPSSSCRPRSPGSSRRRSRPSAADPTPAAIGALGLIGPP